VAQGQTKTTMFFSVILVTHPESYIETTDHRDFSGKPSKWRFQNHDVKPWNRQSRFRTGAIVKNSQIL